MANVPPATVTITSTTGAGQAVTAKVFSNVTLVEFNYTANTIKIVSNNGGTITYFDYSAMSTVTYTISGGLTSITIS
jgi:hypothetical protein